MPDTRAVILAAGRGSRMGHMTSDLPKALVSLAGRRLLTWQIEALKTAGIDDITVVGGYRADHLMEKWPTIRINPRWRETNMVSTLRCACDLLAESTTVVSYADIVYHPAHVSHLLEADAPIALTYDPSWHHLWNLRFEDPLVDAESFSISGRWLQDIGTPVETMSAVQGQYMGLTKFEPSGWHQVTCLLDAMTPDEVDRLDMTTLFRRLLARDVRIEGVPVEGRWCEVDSAEDASLYASLLENDAWSHDWRW